MSMLVLASSFERSSLYFPNYIENDPDLTEENFISQAENPFGTTFEVYLTDKGKKLADEKTRQLSEDKLTDSEERLQQIEAEDEKARRKKERLAFLEKELKNEDLKEEEKNTLQETIVRLLKDSETSADRLSLYYKEKRLAERKLNDEDLSPADRAILRENISLYEQEIDDVQEEMKKRLEEKVALHLQAIKERAEEDFHQKEENFKDLHEKDIRVRPVQSTLQDLKSQKNTAKVAFSSYNR